MNGLTSDFAGFVRNYNKHNMGKTIGELHALLIEYERVYFKKAATPQVMAIQGGRIQKANKKSLNAKGKGKEKGKGKDKSYIPKPKNPKPSAKEHPTKNDTYHHCKEVGHCKRNCLAYLAELINKKKQVGTASSSDIFVIELFSFSTKSWVYDTGCGTHICNTKHGLRGVRNLKQVEAIGSDNLVLPNGLVSCLDNCHYAPTITRGVVSVSCLVDNGFIQCFTDYGVSVFKNNVLYLMLLRVISLHLQIRQSERRNHTLLDIVRSMMNLKTLPLSFWDYALESAARILNMVPTKKVDKTPYDLCQWGGGGIELEEIQDEDTLPSKNTSEIPMEVEGFEPPQEEVIHVRRSERTHQAPERLCLNVELKENSLRDLNEPTNYKAAMLDPEYNKWLDDMNAEMQSMKDNQVWCLVDLSHNGFTQTFTAVYEETFSPVADIRAIRILIAVAAFYDYEIWQMDIKIAFLNGYLDEDIYMVLKQASRSWNKRHNEEIKRFEFAQNLDEPCVYQKASGSNVTFLILYVDDIIIMENHIPSLQSVKTYLGKCFAMNDFREAAFILGIKIYRDRSKRLIGLSQSAYMDKILRRFKIDTSKCGYIPMQERLDLNKTQGASTPGEAKRMQIIPYASAVGSIMYTVRCSRPDVAFAQNITSQAEYIAASEAEMEAVLIRKFISRLGIVPTINEPIKMFCDNSAALLIANEPGVQRDAKHYHRRYLLKVYTYDNLADPFTKALPKGKLTQHARSMELRLASSFM
ncbi:retrotransposon protein, putative, ty1-copia subclass [Tanacetum coccineum]